MEAPHENQIIIDTNILFEAAESRKIPKWLKDMAQHKKSKEVVLILPEIVILELQQKRDAKISAEKKEIKNLENSLLKAGAKVDTSMVDYRNTFSIVDELRALGFKVRVEKALNEDYEDAFRRSSLHLSPIEEGDKESTKDLLILAIALRLASQNKNTMLVANDNLFHRNSKPSKRDGSQKLVRVRSLQSIFTLLSQDSKEVAQLFQKFMPQLKKAKILQFSESDALWKKLDISTMKRDLTGISNVHAEVEISSRDNKQTFIANIEIELTDERTHTLKILGDTPASFSTDTDAYTPSDKYKEDILEVKGIIGGDDENQN